MKLLLVCILLPIITIAAEEKSPSQKFLEIIEARQETFHRFRDKVMSDEVCPGPDYQCILKELKSKKIISSGDLDNALNLFSYVIRKKFQKGECQEICRMNLYAEYSAAIVDFLSTFDRKELYSVSHPDNHPEAKYLIINEELRSFKILSETHEKLLKHRKKIDPSKIFRPALAKRMEDFGKEIEALKPSVLLKGSYLSTLDLNDEAMKKLIDDGAKNEKDKMAKREIVKIYREEVAD